MPANPCPIDSAHIVEVRPSEVERAAEEQYRISAMVNLPEATPVTIVLADGEHVAMQIDVPEFQDTVIGYDELLVHDYISSSC